MFESISSTFMQCGCFLLTGFLFGTAYEVLRFIRLMIRHNALLISIEDTLFLSLCAIVSFIVSLSVGSGYFRIYYVAFEILGISAYFFTLGRLLNFILRRIVGSIKRILQKIFGRLARMCRKVIVAITHKLKSVFVIIYESVTNIIKKHQKRLKSPKGLVYNSKVEGKDERTEKRNVIKAQVRKKT